MHIVIILIIIIFVVLFLCNFQSELYTASIGGKPVYMYNDANKYLFDYDIGFGGWPLWYNKVTPLPFNNPTRFYGYYYYPALQDYYYPRIRYY